MFLSAKNWESAPTLAKTLSFVMSVFPRAFFPSDKNAKNDAEAEDIDEV